MVQLYDLSDTNSAGVHAPGARIGVLMADTRAEKLRRQREAFLDWARTATTDEPPADLGQPQPSAPTPE